MLLVPFDDLIKKYDGVCVDEPPLRPASQQSPVEACPSAVTVGVALNRLLG